MSFTDFLQRNPESDRSRDGRSAERPSVPLHRLCRHRRGRARRQRPPRLSGCRGQASKRLDGAGHGGCVRRASAEDPVSSRSPICWRNIARRDPGKLAIVDLDQRDLDQLRRARAGGHRHRGRAQAARASARAAACCCCPTRRLEKLLIWLGVLAAGRGGRPLNIELNAKLIAELAAAIDPALMLVHKELDGDALLAGKPFVRFGAYSGERGRSRSAGRSLPRHGARRSRRELPERNNAADIACIFCTSGTTAGRRSWSTITAPTGSTGSRHARMPRARPRTTARSNTARSAGTRRRC